MSIVAVQGLNDLAVVTGGTALPASGQSLLPNGAISTFLRTPAQVMIEFWPSVAGGVLSAKVTINGVTTTGSLLGGASIITAGAKQQDIINIAQGESLDLVYSATGGTYRLIVREV
jgi:hypothetical protein